MSSESMLNSKIKIIPAEQHRELGVESNSCPELLPVYYLAFCLSFATIFGILRSRSMVCHGVSTVNPIA